MSAERYRAIRCDRTDTTADRRGTEWSHPVAVAMFAELHESGWRRRAGRNICPEHAPGNRPVRDRDRVAPWRGHYGAGHTVTTGPETQEQCTDRLETERDHTPGNYRYFSAPTPMRGTAA